MLRTAMLSGLLLMTFGLSGCALPYYWQAIGGQIELLRQRSPIEAVIADSLADAQTRTLLEGVAQLRQFAVDELLLPENDSYTTYVDLGRSYVVWNVVAAERFSVDPQRWCFPVAGCVAYRGYFDRVDAEAFRSRLDARGLDTFSGGSGAYSTLGYFADPILNTMLAGGLENAAAILFHELAHQKLYVADDSELSEGYATAIEEYGVEKWLRSRGDAAAIEMYRRRTERREEFAVLVADYRFQLRELYARDLDETEMLAAKAVTFGEMREDYANLKQRWGAVGDYDGWFEQPLNNATLVAVTTYRQWSPVLKARIQAVGLAQFHSDIESIAKLAPQDRVQTLETWVAQDASAAGRFAQP